MRLALGTRNPFSFLFVSSRREQYLARYLIREYASGRSLDDVLDDPYVRNRSTPAERARLLERPEIVEALGKQVIAELKRSLDRGEPVAAERA